MSTPSLEAARDEIKPAPSSMNSYLSDPYFSGFTHDLRSPLFALLGYLQLMDRHMTTNQTEPEKLRDYLSQARQAGRRLDQMISEMLDLARFGNGSCPMEMEVVSIGMLFRRLWETFHVIAQEKKISLRLTIKENDTLTVRADRRYLERALDNLIGNAIKFNRPEGQVVVIASRENEQIRFQISDTGVGIPREAQPFIFEPFAQVRASDRSMGFGLGLPIVKFVALAHGGGVDLTSDPGEGSSFTLWLPDAPLVEP